jgi:hypothetical protein
MSTVGTATRAASSAGGQVLRAATRLVAARPAAKPLHPRGQVVPGTLERFGARPGTGARWLDEAGRDDVVVRRSRAVGLDSPWPDVFGLAVRVTTGPTSYGDLLLASTGLGRLTRFTLVPRTSASAGAMTTLLPYRTPAGPVLLAAVPRDERTLVLSWAVGSGAWQHFAELRLQQDPVAATDVPMSFDPVRNRLPGLDTYDWVRLLREPSYLSARRSRGE